MRIEALCAPARLLVSTSPDTLQRSAPMSPQASRKLETTIALVVIVALFGLLMKTVILVEDPVREAPPRTFGALPVDVRALAPSGVDEGVELTGTLVARRQVALAAETGGRVVRVFADWRPGRRVAAGEELFALDGVPAELARAAAAAQLAEAEARATAAAVDAQAAKDAVPHLEAAFEVATRLRQRLEKLLATGETSASMVDDALVGERQAAIALQAGRSRVEQAGAASGAAQATVETARAALAQAEDAVGRLAFRAPFAGELTGYGPARGDLLLPGGVVGTLVDPGSLVLVAQVHESRLARVAPGAEVAVTLPAFPGFRSAGRVAGRAPSADVLTRNVALDIEVETWPAQVTAGLFARARVAGGPLPAGTVRIGRDEVVWAGGAALAFVVNAAGDEALPTALIEPLEVGEDFVVGAPFTVGQRLVTRPLDRMATERPTAIVLANGPVGRVGETGDASGAE